jgi:predicted nucleic acid-binding protein
MATTAGKRVFLDTNVLIFAQSALAPEHSVAVVALKDLENSGSEVWISRQVLREYLSGMTRPGTFTGTTPISSLIAHVANFQSQFRIAEDGPAVTGELLRLLTIITSQGKQVHDANIVATMLAHGIPNLLTHNVADFVRFTGLINVVPLTPPTPPAQSPPAAPATPPLPPPGAP